MANLRNYNIRAYHLLPRPKMVRKIAIEGELDEANAVAQELVEEYAVVLLDTDKGHEIHTYYEGDIIKGTDAHVIRIAVGA